MCFYVFLVQLHIVIRQSRVKTWPTHKKPTKYQLSPNIIIIIIVVTDENQRICWIYETISL